MTLTKVMKKWQTIVTVAATLMVSNVYGQSADLQGSVTIDGSSTVYPVSEAVAAGFHALYPKVNVTVATSGTGGGFKRFAKGETDISNASRPITAEEFKIAQENGVQFYELPVALDGLSIIVSKENTWASELTVEQLTEIYKEGGKGKNWSDINAAWPNEPIKVYSPGTDSGTFDYFKEVIIGKKGNFRNDMSTSEDDNVLVTGVVGNKYAIGYLGAAYYYENKDKLKALGIVNPKTGKAVHPEIADVVSGNYFPLSRPLFIYVNQTSLRKPAIRKFVEYYMENDASFAKKVGYVEVPREINTIAKSFMKDKKTGTTYLTSEMKKPEGTLAERYKAENLVDTKK